ncbi:MAG: hypothetical protein GC159_10880 [Phycisphaera sp.]|nr:hypothetical protein [Phycisphaera sp.]
MTSSTSHAQDAAPARDRYLLLDSRIIARVENATLAVGTVTKHPANPLFGEDRPWEKRFDNLYGNVIYDRDEHLYKLWYNPIVVDYSAKGMTREERDAKKYVPPPGRQTAICYATSKDGLHWDKPELGMAEYDGSTANNIIERGPHGNGVFKDEHETDPARRYKMISQGIRTRYSADGIHWSPAARINDIGKIPGDTHNNCFWDPRSGKYIGITRTRGPLGREVTRIESNDFVTWTNTGVIMRGETKELQPYAMPVFMHAGVYIGLVAIHEQPPVDLVWTELAWSPDTITWHRIQPGTPLIPRSQKVLDYDYGCVYACANPVFLDDEIRLYYGASDYLHFGWRVGSLCLATLRPDGFAGYTPTDPANPAVITTTPIPNPGQSLRLTADVSKGGSINVTVLDADNKVIATAAPVDHTVTDGVLQFDKPVTSATIRLRFEVTKGKVYSFGWKGE